MGKHFFNTLEPFGDNRRTALHEVVYGIPEREIDGDTGHLHSIKRRGVVKLLLELPDIDVNAQDATGNTPLHRAIVCIPQLPFGYDDPALDDLDKFGTYFQEWEVIQPLLKHGADPNIANLAGDTPMHLAAERGRQGILYHLFLHGGDPRALNRDRWTPLHYATQYRYQRVIDFINEEIANRENPDLPAPLPEPISLPGEE